MNANEKQQLEDIYIREAKKLYSYLYHLCGNKELAEDLTSETFFRAARSISKFRGECSELTWLCQIGKHLWYRHLKQKPPLPADEAAEVNGTEESPEQIVFAQFEKLEWFQKLQGLDALTREVMYLRLYGELSFREIGEILGKTESWARVTFYRGKQKLKGVYENERNRL
ncbi:MAG: sigma-70 family RNA polymerase sigma factor [Clostridiales bacterium]|nr:sigma-70 family RNA polymerase sigma factor [Clostridiales bacterium]